MKIPKYSQLDDFLVSQGLNKYITSSDFRDLVDEKLIKGMNIEKSYKLTIKSLRQKIRRYKYREYYNSLGINDNLINRYNLISKNPQKIDKQLLNKIKRKSQREKLEQRKKDTLERLNVKYKKQDLKKSWKFLQQKYNIKNDLMIEYGKFYLYIGFADVLGYFFNPNVYKGFSVDFLQEEIEDMINDAMLFEDDSSSFIGAWVYDYGSKLEMQRVAKAYYQRGYLNNFIKKDMNSKVFSVLTLSNTWSKQTFLEMVCTILLHMKNIDRIEFYSFIRRYSKINSFNFI